MMIHVQATAIVNDKKAKTNHVLVTAPHNDS